MESCANTGIKPRACAATFQGTGRAALSVVADRLPWVTQILERSNEGGLLYERISAGFWKNHEPLASSQQCPPDHVAIEWDGSFEAKVQLNGSEITVRNKRLFSIFIVFSLVAVLYLPYFFPVPPSASESYIFGYSNAAGVLFLLLLASLGALWTKGLNLPFLSNGESSKVPLKYLWLFLFIESAACATMYWRVHRFGGVAEAGYEVQRIWLLSQGKIPYIDFAWAYGAGLLYGPLWICKCLHLSIANGYYLFWAAACLAGIVLLYIVVNLVDYPTTRRKEIFLLLGISWFLCVPSLGVNYSALRFVCPLFFVLLIYKMSRRSGRFAYPAACFLAIVFTAVLFLISTETAVSLVFASSIILYMEMPVSYRRLAFFCYLPTLACLAVLILLAYKLHVLDSVKTAGGGDIDLPITLAPVTLLFFAAVFICACYLVNRSLRTGCLDNTIAIVIFSIPMTAAALGRCDPVHILGNGMGFLLAAFYYAGGLPRLWKIYRTAFITCFIVLNGLTVGVFALIYRGGHSHSMLPENANLALIYPESKHLRSDGIFEVPFGYVPNGGAVYLSPQLDYGYYYQLDNAGTPDGIRRKIDQLRQHPERGILLTKNFLSFCKVYPETEREFLSLLLAFPYLARPAHTQSINKPFCDYILTHYDLAESATPETFQYELWTPKN